MERRKQVDNINDNEDNKKKLEAPMSLEQILENYPADLLENEIHFRGLYHFLHRQKNKSWPHKIEKGFSTSLSVSVQKLLTKELQPTLFQENTMMIPDDIESLVDEQGLFNWSTLSREKLLEGKENDPESIKLLANNASGSLKAPDLSKEFSNLSLNQNSDSRNNLQEKNNKAPEKKAPEKKEKNNKYENKAPENKDPENKDPENKDPENKDPENKENNNKCETTKATPSPKTLQKPQAQKLVEEHLQQVKEVTNDKIQKSYRDAREYRYGSKSLKKLFPFFHSFVTKMSAPEFTQRYSKFFALTPDPEKLPRIFSFHKEGKSFLACSMLCTVLEKLLRDAIYSQAPNDVVAIDVDAVPTKLSELLAHPIITECLNSDQHFLLTVSVGLLCALNVRNVILHGFYSEAEFEPELTSFMLLQVLSLCPSLTQKPFSWYPWIKLETTWGFSSVENRAHLFLEKSGLTSGSTENCLHQYDLDYLKKIVDNSLFVLPGTERTWGTIFEEMNHARFSSALLLLFPLVEHGSIYNSFSRNKIPNFLLTLISKGFRKIFAFANQSSSALRTTDGLLYTTLDIMFLTRFEREEEMFEANRVYQVLPPSICNFFLDCFIWKGFRLRDLICHDLIDPATVPAEIAHYFVLTMIGILSYYQIEEIGPSPYRACQSYIEGYGSKHWPLFHPQTKFFESFLVIAERVQKSEKSESPSPDPNAAQLISQFAAIAFPEAQARFQIQPRFDNLPFSIREEAKLTILQDIVAHVQTIHQQYFAEIEKLSKLADSNRSKGSQRRRLAYLSENTPLLIEICDFLLLIVHLEFLQMLQGGKSTIFAKKIFDYSQSGAATNQFTKFLQRWQLLSSEKPLEKVQDFSAKECSRLWADLPSTLVQYRQFFRQTNNNNNLN